MLEVEEYIRRENWPAIPHDIMKVFFFWMFYQQIIQCTILCHVNNPLFHSRARPRGLCSRVVCNQAVLTLLMWTPLNCLL